MASVTSFVTRRLQLRVNTAKSAATPCPGVPEPAGRLGVGDQDRMGTPGVDHPSRLEFLGFGFTAGKAPPQRGCGDPPEPSGAAPRGTAHRAAGAGPARDAGPGADAADQRGLARADDPRPGGLRSDSRSEQGQEALEAKARRPWIRFAKRTGPGGPGGAWKQWRNGWNRFRQLSKRGVPRRLAAQTAGSAHGPLRGLLAASPPEIG